MNKLGLGFLLSISLIAFQTEKIQAQVSRSPAIEVLRTTPQQVDERLGWWRDARFGMFIHWGVSAEIAGTWHSKVYYGYAEHIQRMAMIPIPTYIKEVAGNFNPVKFNADEWIRIAKQTGVRYFIITAKHHDGIAMYDSKFNDHTIMKSTPFKHDPMVDLVKACKKYGIKFGFYYSHAFDWGEENAPGNDWDYNNPGGDKLLSGSNWWEKDKAFLKKAQKYVDEKAIPQIVELIKNYDPDIMWFDTPHKLPNEENGRIMAAVRKAKPSIVINGRLIYGIGDYQNTNDCPEDFQPTDGDWEGIPTTNNSYGYNKNDLSHKPAGHFIRLLAKAVARGGNLLMNIGPKGDGEIDSNDMKILTGIGKWFNVNSSSIRGCARTPLQTQAWGETTLKGNNLYLHVFEWTKNGNIILGGVKGEVKKAYLLSDVNKMLKVKREGLDLNIQIPRTAPDTIDAVVVVEFKTPPTGDYARLISPAISSNLLRSLDAKLAGGVEYGDGTRNQNYVKNWKTLQGSISWDIRITKKTSFNIIASYEVPEKSETKLVEGNAGKEIQYERKGAGGIYQISIGKNIFTKEVVLGGTKRDAVGELTLEPGNYQIKVSAKEITGEELFWLNNLELIPANLK